jgi:glycosyltransferase involved in cell wall biosynthesis
VKDDLVEHFNINPGKIEVIWGAAAEWYKIIDISERERQDLLTKYNIKKNFLLCTGGDDDRKGMKELIEAFGKLPKNLKEEYQLVIVCGLTPQAVEKYNRIVSENKVSGKVVFTNFVANEELVLFYNLCTLMVFVSQYEGFGLPVVEAFSCGAPVLTSNNSSLCQIAGDGAILVDPFDINKIRDGLIEALTKADLKELAKKGIEQAKKFSWENVAQSTRGAFESLIDTKKVLDSQLPPQNINNKRRISFFTPLPPLQSGIADYSLDIIKALSLYCLIDVFIDTGYKINCSLPDTVNVFPHTEFKHRTNQYEKIVYQLGNSDFHVYMWDYIQTYPGIIVLHDFNLHGILYNVCFGYGKTNFDMYRNALQYDFDTATVDTYINDLASGICGPKYYDMEVNGFLTNYADMIIVHSHASKIKLLESDISKNIDVIQHYCYIKSQINTEELKIKYDLANTMVFAAFGQVHFTKRVVPIIKAFKKLTEIYDNIKLIFAGRLLEPSDKDMDIILAENGLLDKVITTGYIDLETMEEYMDLSDICLNLRHPYNGETSGSLMRLLGKGKPVIINDVGSFGELPDGAVLKIPNAKHLAELKEIECIFKAMEKLINSNEREKLSTAALQYSKKNLDINLIAKHYYDSIFADNKINLINNDLLNNILKNEIISKGYTDDQIKKLSYTLGYIKASCN